MTNWAIEILPFIEEGGLYDRYDHKVDNLHVRNRIVLQTNLAVFNCPSDPNMNTLQEPQNTSARPNYPNDPNFPPNSNTKCATGSYRAVGGQGFRGAARTRCIGTARRRFTEERTSFAREARRDAHHGAVQFEARGGRQGEGRHVAHAVDWRIHGRHFAARASRQLGQQQLWRQLGDDHGQHDVVRVGPRLRAAAD